MEKHKTAKPDTAAEAKPEGHWMVITETSEVPDRLGRMTRLESGALVKLDADAAHNLGAAARKATEADMSIGGTLARDFTTPVVSTEGPAAPAAAVVIE